MTVLEPLKAARNENSMYSPVCVEGAELRQLKLSYPKNIEFNDEE